MPGYYCDSDPMQNPHDSPSPACDANPSQPTDPVCLLVQATCDHLLREGGFLGCDWDACPSPGLYVKVDPDGRVLRVEEPGRMRVDLMVYASHGIKELVVECRGAHDTVMERLLPMEAYFENLGEHVICLGPYRGVVSPMDFGDEWRRLVFRFDVSADPLRLRAPLLLLLGILTRREMPPGHTPAMYYSHPAPAEVRWVTL